METSSKIEQLLTTFKSNIFEQAQQLEIFVTNENGVRTINPDISSNMQNLLLLFNYIETYSPSNEKPLRKKRSVTVVDENIRCLAILEDKNQCPRKKAAKKDFCTIHKKNAPFGIIQGQNGHQNRILVLEKIEGIDYYVDEHNRIYSMEAILMQVPNPPVIGTKELNKETQQFFCQILKDPAIIL